MLSFLRKNSIKIVYGIIIAFVVTTFMGVVFFNNSFNESNEIQQRQSDRESAIAMIGEIPVNRQVFLLEFRRLQASIPQNMRVNNSLIENIQLNSLNKAIESTLLLEIGLDQKVKASRNEINAALFSVMEQFNVSSKKELKSAIKNSGGSYESMLQQLKNDIIATKIQQALINSVEITQLDNENINKKFKIKELFVSRRTTQNNLIDDEILYTKASDIRSKISDSKSFDIVKSNLYKEYNVSYNVNSNWITINQINPDLARAIYSMNINEISQPIRTKNGYYIIELVNKDDLEESAQFDSNVLIQDWQKMIVYSFLFEAQKGREIKILDPSLKALHFKSQGRYDEAIEAYQGTISKEPSNPYPNVLIAQLYLLKGDVANAKQSLLKAEIKETLISDQIIVPEIHLLLANIYNEEGFSSKRDEQYDKLISNKDLNIDVLKFLKKTFEETRDNFRLGKVSKLISDQENTSNILENASSLSSDEDAEFLKGLIQD